MTLKEFPYISLSSSAIIDSATRHCCWHLSATDGLPEIANKRRKSAGLATTPIHHACTGSGGEIGEEGGERSSRREAENQGWGEEMEALHRHAILEHVAAIMESKNGGQRVTIVINLFALVHTTLVQESK